MFEKEAEDSFNCKKVLYKWETDKRSYIDGFKDGAEFGYNKSKAETALLSQHILDLQKDKGNLTDSVRELEQQIEKMKCWCNCKNYLSCLEECCRKNISFEKGICYNCKKWELRR